jgi:3-phosphoshikimate 1-carboxyvinyltransferase
MTLPALLPIIPFCGPLEGAIDLPGSKSITNRALLLSALSEMPVTLTGVLFGEDTHLMMTALRQMGFSVVANPESFTVRISRLCEPPPCRRIKIDVGLAGTVARFIAAYCCSCPGGTFEIDGTPRMRRRPMQVLIRALRALGADIRCLEAEGFLPVEIHARGLKGGQVALDAGESSQFISALLMVSPLALEPVRLSLSAPAREKFVHMTASMMSSFGVPVKHHAGSKEWAIEPGKFKSPLFYHVEPDATAASYFHALAAITDGHIEIPHLPPPSSSLQGDTAFPEILRRFMDGSAGPVAVEDFHEISDTFLTLAAIAPVLRRPLKLTGLTHTRNQECDRVSGAARELHRLGQHVLETEGTLEIHPRPLVPNQIIESYSDHRFAMSFAILGCHDLKCNGEPWLTIDNPGCCSKTFPTFFATLNGLRGVSRVM